MSEFAQAYQSPSFGSLSIELPPDDFYPTDVPSNDLITNDFPKSNEIDPTIYPMYQRGYTEGEEDGYARGSENGYYHGYRHGKRDGYEEGYKEGIHRGLWFGTAWAVVASIMMFGMRLRSDRR
jgi:hypothetical protein